MDMEPVKALAVRIVRADGSGETRLSPLLREQKLEIIVNGECLQRLTCTGTALKELAAGFLYTSRTVDSPEELAGLALSPDGKRAELSLQRGARKRPLHRLTDRTGWSDGDVFRLAARFQEQLPLHAATDSTHCCFLLRRGEIIFESEDMGRHNALDKAAGFALLRGVPLGECVAYTSGRAPLDMAEKAVAAGIPVLVSKATPTAESVAFAEKYGLTLLCRAWTDRYEVFARPGGAQSGPEEQESI